MFTINEYDKRWLIILGVLALIPIWRAGDRKNMTFYEFVYRHTIFSEDVMYVPEELDSKGRLMPYIAA